MRFSYQILADIKKAQGVVRLPQKRQNLLIIVFTYLLHHELSRKMTSSWRYWILGVEDAVAIEGEIFGFLIDGLLTLIALLTRLAYTFVTLAKMTQLGLPTLGGEHVMLHGHEPLLLVCCRVYFFTLLLGK